MQQMEAALAQLQGELAMTRQQMITMATSHDALRQQHERLRQASEAAFQAKAAEIASSERKLQNLMFNQKFDLLDMKTITPDEFKGKHSEAFKPWARKVKAFCNAKRSGFRKGPGMGRDPGPRY